MRQDSQPKQLPIFELLAGKNVSTALMTGMTCLRYKINLRKMSLIVIVVVPIILLNVFGSAYVGFLKNTSS